MMKSKSKRSILAGCFSGVLLIGSLLVYFGTYKAIIGKADKTVTIGVFSDSYWEVQNGYSYRILDNAISTFEKQYPDIQVKYTSGILKEDYSEWLSEQLLSENAPDVFFVLAEDFSNFAELGVLENLVPFIEKDREFHSEAFYSSAYAYGQYDEGQYSLPYECAPKLMFVNKSILDKERVKVPDEDWTWDDFYEICKKVTKDTDGNGTVDQFGAVGYTWEEAFESNGVKLFNRRGTECYLTDKHASK